MPLLSADPNKVIKLLSERNKKLWHVKVLAIFRFTRLDSGFSEIPGEQSGE